MKHFSKLIAVGAIVAAGALSFATASTAADLTTFAQYTQIGRANNLSFTQSASHTGGTLKTIGTPSVNFSFLDSGFSTVAKFVLNATVTEGSPAILTGPSEYQQDHLGGTFSFLSAGAFTFNSIAYAAGTNLLSASFSEASLNSTGTSGGVSDSTVLGHMINFTSAVFDTSPFTDEDFSFTLTGARPAITAIPGRSLSNFTASSTGSFSAAAVPEPASWALMIAGFGGVGAVLRRRRTATAFA